MLCSRCFLNFAFNATDHFSVTTSQGDFHHPENWMPQTEDTLIAAGSSRTTKAQEILASDCEEKWV